jgi:uncharacterized protein YndB with AHSA1/START domain
LTTEPLAEVSDWLHPFERFWRQRLRTLADIAAVVGHRFHLEMPGRGSIPCEVTEVEPHERFVYTFNGNWTLTWRLVVEGTGTPAAARALGFRPRRQTKPRRLRAHGPGLARRGPARTRSARDRSADCCAVVMKYSRADRRG